MVDKNYDVVIIGAGLSGLASALLLVEAGKSVCVLEARDRVGGRIRSVLEDETHKHLADLGPTWVWPMFQPVISSWLDKLGLNTFPQFETGNAILDYGTERAIQEGALPAQQGSMRVENGSQALVDALVKKLPKDALFTNAQVTSVGLKQEGGVEVQTTNEQYKNIYAQKLIVALPPRIALKTIKWIETLPTELSNVLDRMPTWMAPHAKVAAVYEKPFWREKGLSGRIASRVGPIVEGHDHCSADGSTAAIWGFVGWPHDMRMEQGSDLKTHVLEQLKRCFGEEPISITIEDWSQDGFVTSPNDLSSPMHHPNVGPDILRQGHFKNRVWFAGAETAERSPGLIEGAFDAANETVKRVLIGLGTL